MIEIIARVDWVQFSTLVIALCAMYVAVVSIRQNNRHNRLSLKPHLVAHFRSERDQSVALEIENRGLGPAILTDWSLWHETRPEQIVYTAQSAVLKQLLRECLPTGTRYNLHSKQKDSVLKVGECWQIFLIEANQHEQKMREIEKVAEGIKMEIRYKSHYDEYSNLRVSK